MADFNPSTGEGEITATGVWATIRGQATGDSTADVIEVISTNAGATLRRVFLPFDTSSLPDDATVLSAILKLYRDDSLDAFVNADTTSLEIVPQTQANNTSLAVTDFGSITFSSKGTLNFSATSNTAYNNITITDLTQISLTGYTKLAVISGRDLNNNAPAGQNQIAFQNRGAANPPILTVTFTTPGGQTETAYFM